MIRTTLVFLGLACGGFAFADDDANKADLKRMQGKWKIVSVSYEERAEKKVGDIWTIKDNKMFVGGGWVLRPDPRRQGEAKGVRLRDI